MTVSDYLKIADLTADRVIYRDLQPCDGSLPGLMRLRANLDLAPDVLPRKRDADYSRMVFALLSHMQAQRNDLPLRVLLVIGDTDNDRRMIEHLRAASNLPVFGFIGVDQTEREPGYTWKDDTATATRWSLLDDWHKVVGWRYDTDTGELPWAQTALLLDIDKTLLGPRGRGDEQINQARAEAAFQVTQSVLQADIDAEAFYTLYNTMCSSEFYSLTLDNQDYIVYITLLLAGGVLSAQEFIAGIHRGTFATFAMLLDAVGHRVPLQLYDLHVEIRAAHAAGDPTPFKAFRRAEFAATAARMEDGRLTLCREVVALSQWMIEQGALCMAASDKPAESALPSPGQTLQGLQPLHHTPARVT